MIVNNSSSLSLNHHFTKLVTQVTFRLIESRLENIFFFVFDLFLNYIDNTLICNFKNIFSENDSKTSHNFILWLQIQRFLTISLLCSYLKLIFQNHKATSVSVTENHHYELCIPSKIFLQMSVHFPFP